MNMHREDEEISQTSSDDTLLGSPSVRWRKGIDGGFRMTDYRGATKYSTALIVHALLFAVFGGGWLLLFTFYGYEYPYGPNMINS